nr:uncharacterized abhydrolase domain-containing protein DDB_G0269086-like [Aegilops tauschii subsp. strangulata]
MAEESAKAQADAVAKTQAEAAVAEAAAGALLVTPLRAMAPEILEPPPEEAAATAQAAEVSELKRKLELADEDLIRINKRLDEVQGSAAAVESLKSALAQAKEHARVSQAASEKAATDLETEQVTRRKYEERVTEVEQELKDAASKCEALEEKNKTQAVNLTKALQEAKEARTESPVAREAIKQGEQIAAVFPGPRREHDGEALLVAVPGAGAASAAEQPDDAAGGAA